MDLSIVIVNYNVGHFLIKCLDSIFTSQTQFTYEVIIVDNASTDNSVALLKIYYPQIKIIENKVNVGFSKANNQGFKESNARFVLVLNPDTIIQEDTIEKSINYLLQHPNCGVLGVKFIDGSGYYLEESKRGQPNLWNSFCKMVGLSKIFKNSKIFNGYYLGHLDKNQNHLIDILCGAFMMFRKDVLNVMQGFDEAFFMYGEDVDLSQRISKAGYEVRYLSETKILHFKGESSRRTTFNYIKNFYNAMIIFVDKNYHGGYGLLMKFFIKISIWLSGILNFIKNNIIDHLSKIFDGFILYYCFKLMKKFWGHYRFSDQNYFENSASLYNSIGAIIIWIFSIWLFGHYDRNWKWNRLFVGIIFGTITILLVYSLLPSDLRSSRAMILIGTLPLMVVAYSSMMIRKAINKLINNNSNIYGIYGKDDEIDFITKLIKSKNKNIITEKLFNRDIQLYQNIIISNQELSYADMLDLMENNQGKNYYIFSDKEKILLSSGNKNTQGSLYYNEMDFKLSQGFYKRLKRIYDIIFSFYSVLLILFTKTNQSWKEKILSNLILVLKSKKTWVGYSKMEFNLPFIKDGVFNTESLINDSSIYPIIGDTSMADIYYAKQYSIFLDYKICLQKNENDRGKN